MAKREKIFTLFHLCFAFRAPLFRIEGASKAAWHRYLVVKWGGENPDLTTLQVQVDRALVKFNIERIHYLRRGESEWSFPPTLPTSLAYLTWNVFFAFAVRQCR